jgi:hypothetical protein
MLIIPRNPLKFRLLVDSNPSLLRQSFQVPEFLATAQ